MNSSANSITRGLLLGALGGSAWPALAATPQPLQVAFVYVGPVGEAGWSFAHDAARKAVERSFGAQVRVMAVPSVHEGGDAERVLRDLVAQGNRLVFATSFGYMEPALRVAADHPDVKFEHATGFKTAAIWLGPLQDNRGKQVLAEGQIGDDAFLRRMGFYVKGVEGRVHS